MVSVSDYPQESSLYPTHDAMLAHPKKHRFRLLAALAAPFRDMDERALHKKRKDVPVQNNSKGNMFPPRTAALNEASAGRLPRSDD